MADEQKAQATDDALQEAQKALRRLGRHQEVAKACSRRLRAKRRRRHQCLDCGDPLSTTGIWARCEGCRKQNAARQRARRAELKKTA